MQSANCSDRISSKSSDLDEESDKKASLPRNATNQKKWTLELNIFDDKVRNKWG